MSLHSVSFPIPVLTAYVISILTECSLGCPQISVLLSHLPLSAGVLVCDHSPLRTILLIFSEKHFHLLSFCFLLFSSDSSPLVFSPFFFSCSWVFWLLSVIQLGTKINNKVFELQSKNNSSIPEKCRWSKRSNAYVYTKHLWEYSIFIKSHFLKIIQNSTVEWTCWNILMRMN